MSTLAVLFPGALNLVPHQGVVVVVEGDACSGLSCLLSGPHSIEKIFEKTQKFFFLSPESTF